MREIIATAEDLHLPPLCGIVSYGLPAVASWMVCARWGRHRMLIVWVALIDSFLLLDSVFNWRWRIHAFFSGIAIDEGVYGRRRGPQAIVLLLLAGFLFAACIFALARLRGRMGAVLAVWGVLFALALWITETISLHQVDHVLYHSEGPLLEVCLLRLAIATLTTAGVVVEARRIQMNAILE